MTDLKASSGPYSLVNIRGYSVLLQLAMISGKDMSSNSQVARSAKPCIGLRPKQNVGYGIHKYRLLPFDTKPNNIQDPTQTKASINGVSLSGLSILYTLRFLEVRKGAQGRV